MEVETEADVYEPFEEYVKHAEVKLQDDTSAEVGNETNVTYQANSSSSSSEIEQCGLVPREVKPVKGQQGTLVSLRLPATGVGL